MNEFAYDKAHLLQPSQCGWATRLGGMLVYAGGKLVLRNHILRSGQVGAEADCAAPGFRDET